MVRRTHRHWIFRMMNVKANRLYVVGDFNEWSTTATAMKEIEPNVWEVVLELQPATYRFRYVTDDSRWFTDYAAFGVKRNDFGGWNSVVHVPQVDEPAQTVIDAYGLTAEGISRLNDLMEWVANINITQKGNLQCEDEDDKLESLSRLNKPRRRAATEPAPGARQSRLAITAPLAQTPIKENRIYKAGESGEIRPGVSPVGVS